VAYFGFALHAQPWRGRVAVAFHSSDSLQAPARAAGRSVSEDRLALEKDDPLDERRVCSYCFRASDARQLSLAEDLAAVSVLSAEQSRRFKSLVAIGDGAQALIIADARHYKRSEDRVADLWLRQT
jgi:hypothetical protein